METHKEDYYWLTGEVLTEEQFLQDCNDDGLFMVPEKRKPLWTLGDTPERVGKPRPFGFNSNARGPDEVNL